MTPAHMAQQRQQANFDLSQRLADIVGSRPLGKLYTYAPDTSPVILGASATVQAIITITSDADFDTYIINSVALDNTNAIIANNYLLTIKERNTEDLMNQSIHALTITGSGERSFFLPTIHRFIKTQVVRLTFVNLTAAEMRVHLSFIGGKVYCDT